MQQYLIYAFDGTDNEALARRMAARPAHLANVAKLKQNDNYLIGGAILSDNGQMIGSSMLVKFETQAQFEDWYNNDPYITQNVWQNVTVHPFRTAMVE